MRKLLPIILALVGLAAGTGAGLALRPAAEHADPGAAADALGETRSDEPAEAGAAGKPLDEASPQISFDYARLNNQFVVPVLDGGQVAGLVVLTLSLEVSQGNTETVYSREPKLRDAFLKVLFDHAAAGGFDGDFTAPTKLAALRRALTEQAAQVLGPIANDVLIQEIVRQNV